LSHALMLVRWRAFISFRKSATDAGGVSPSRASSRLTTHI